MPRKPRILGQSVAHHVVHRGIDRQAIYLADADRYLFLSLLRWGCREHGLKLVAYCLMDNHFHLFLEDAHARLSSLMQMVSGPYTLAFNRRHAREGALLRGRFFSKPVTDDGYALRLLHYIHENPVSAMMVDTPSAYAWSSARDYLLGRPNSDVTSTMMFDLLQAHAICCASLDQWSPPHDTQMKLTLPRDCLPLAKQAEQVSRTGVSIDVLAAQDGLSPASREHCRSILQDYAGQVDVPSHVLLGSGKKSREEVTLARYAAVIACVDVARISHAQAARLFGLKRKSVGNVVARGRSLLSKVFVDGGLTPHGLPDAAAPSAESARRRAK